MAGNNILGGSDKKMTNIFLTVNTTNINGNNVDQHVKFSDDRSNREPGRGRPQDFVSEVEKGGRVSWEGKAENTSESIQIMEIIPKDTDGKGKILEKVENDTGRKGRKIGIIRNSAFKGEEAYSVKFRINDDASREFVIDPKLRML